MAACEQRQLDYLFKLRLTTKVKALIQLVSGRQAAAPPVVAGKQLRVR